MDSEQTTVTAPTTVQTTGSINSLKRKLQAAAKEVQHINDIGRQALTDSKFVSQFKGMFRAMERYFSKFEACWDELMDIQEPTDKDKTLKGAVQKYFYEANITYEMVTSTDTQVNSGNITVNESFTSHTLPRINIPSFDGEIMNWPRFRDTYVSLVHNDVKLTVMQKFYYLVSFLSGAASSTINHLKLEEANYELAWHTLIETYDNKRLLASTYLNQIVNFKPLQGQSIEDFKLFLTQVVDSVAAFKLLKIEHEAEFILFHLAIKSLDATTRRQFELSHKENEFPTFDQLSKFVKTQYNALKLVQNINPNNSSTKESIRKPRTMQDGKSKALVANSVSYQKKTQQVIPCIICNEGIHSLLHCAKFYAATPSQRINWLKDWNGCRNCLSYNHKTVKCFSKWHCRLCSKRHHTMLHLDSPIVNKVKKPEISTVQEASGSSSDSKVLNVSSNDIQILLGTVSAKIQDAKGNYHTIRLVVDSGSQHSFITEKIANRLGLDLEYFPRKISGIGETLFEGAKGQLNCCIRPRNSFEPVLTTKAIVVKNITSLLPNFLLPSHIQERYQVYELADPNFFKPMPVDFLLGADLFPEICFGNTITFDENSPKLFSSIFGYIVMGKVSSLNCSTAETSLFSCSDCDDLKEQLQRFWELEEPTPIDKQQDPKEVDCEEHFLKTHYRLKSGRYVVHLPFKDDPPDLKESFSFSEKRFYNLEKRLRKNDSLYSSYKRFMQEYIDLDHMSLARSPSSYIIPHHCVTKEDRGELKIRVVFDASAKTSQGSLNDYVYVGEKLQNDIRDILLKFRAYPVVFVADIMKMYRNILVDPADRQYQQIYWRFDPSESLQRYELNTVTYGLSCAPFLALRVIRQLCLDEGSSFPEAAKILESDMYVDDLVTGCNSISEALELQRQVIELLEKGGFSLSKWASNVPQILKRFSDGDKSSLSPLQLSDKEENSIKILGLQWDSTLDNFTYKFKTIENLAYTKRNILSIVARVYDPLGFLSPLVFLMKGFIQELWKHNYGWDQIISEDLQVVWNTTITQLPAISEIKIPRFVGPFCQSKAQVVGFSDASTKGYCGVLYLRIEMDSNINVHLLAAKTKLAPLKTISIPRLELCAALLLCKLFHSIAKFIDTISTSWINPCFFTDSSTVLHWLQTPSFKLKTFVANRVTEINTLSANVEWRHISTEDNPSDCGSRGILPQQLIDHQLWWSGPSFLRKLHSEWPSENIPFANELPDVKPHSVLVAKVQDVDYSQDFLLNLMLRFSSYTKMLRVIAWIRRLRRDKGEESSSPRQFSLFLMPNEVNDSLMMCIKHVQLQYFFKGNLRNLAKIKVEFRQLTPFLDEAGLLRVGGRLRNSALSEDHKHPILLPAKCHFTTLLIDHYHLLYLHAGPSLLQARLQEKFWVVSLRRLIRQRIFNCLKCYKSQAKPSVPLMADLPKCNVMGGQAFGHTGVDFAGPFLLRESLRRKAALSKAYLCLFVCLNTKALHLEVVSSMSSEAFLAAFDRFKSRRGLPNHMYSDCGTNFVGAANQIKEFYQYFKSQHMKEAINRYAIKWNFSWHFNPPHAPHFGGRWEAAVKLAKRNLMKVAGNTPLTFEELSTLFSNIEAALNSRPLCPLSPSPEENDYLTPGHFLIGRPLLSNPEPSLLEMKDYLLSRWQLVKKMTQYFWRRWRTEYLSTLQVRNKWTKKNTNIKVGDLVMFKEDAPVNHWNLARVVEIHPGADGAVRVVTIKMGKGTYKRPVSKLAPLEPLNR